MTNPFDVTRLTEEEITACYSAAYPEVYEAFPVIAREAHKKLWRTVGPLLEALTTDPSDGSPRTYDGFQCPVCYGEKDFSAGDSSSIHHANDCKAEQARALLDAAKKEGA